MREWRNGLKWPKLFQGHILNIEGKPNFSHYISALFSPATIKHGANWLNNLKLKYKQHKRKKCRFIVGSQKINEIGWSLGKISYSEENLAEVGQREEGILR